MRQADDLLTISVACDFDAAAIVRAELAGVHETSWSLDDARLVATELVTNAIRHSGADDTHRLGVVVRRGDGVLSISVHDPGLSGAQAQPAQTDRSEPGGWGLRIVEEVAERWDSERSDGYRVWAELPVAA